MSEDIFIKNLNTLLRMGKISKKYFDILAAFYNGYYEETISVISKKEISSLFNTLLDLLVDQFKNPHAFDLYHQKITQPFDYQKFGMDFLKPLVDLKKSKVYGIDNLKEIKKYLDKNENVILLSNHQSEVDPQLLNILLEDSFFSIASNIILVAGERVIIDPIAIPFSMGCNLLCIYSKRYINIDLKQKHQKQIHNKNVMSRMRDLLSTGGKIIYVAPSGGRDRKNKKGKIEIANFDPQSLEMFYLMAKKAKTPTHFFPLTLATYNILPPPLKIQIELGETRVVNRSSVLISFSPEINLEKFPGSDEKNKIKRRKNKAKYIHNIVKEEYEKITQGTL
ncbi:MAG: hypothetical protein K940chlam1_00911 [Candidatus Anoxychlamydiales bacterium]|nr:hypothetical protein [Candidatus Anoxychlamydiales bacterium]NGX36498.1 hypothetical protein [Candidatus Anoxychlamydiales bacterium]